MSPIMIISPNGFTEEKKYIFDLISEFTGSEFKIEFQESQAYKFILPNGKTIIIDDRFFGALEENNSYLNKDFIPKEIQYLSNDYAENLPILFGDESYSEVENEISLGFDIMASIFFMVSRWEEVVTKERDDHGRFSGNLSLAVNNKFIKRPVVDEYITLIKKLIGKLDPCVTFKQHKPEVLITSDIDSFAKFNSGKTLKMFAGHLLKRFSPALFFTDLFQLTGKRIFGKKDPYDTFDRIFNIAEKFKTKPIFFILSAPEGPYNDGWFAAATYERTRIFKSLSDKGAALGLHYGYFSLLNRDNIRSEKFELEKKYGIPIKKGRAHFLQFDVMNSFDILKQSGISEDFTLGYSRHAGFRCGTGRAFKPWDFNRKCAHEIIERPLIVMDTTLFGHNKMSKTQIKAELKYYLDISKKYNTDLTILIHNSSPKFVFEAIEEV
ncbi:MAG: hypothetical protein KKD38_06380 [Candidatus Delongbacteria bacterium]|nr:hypothetical protein [Candidatus Delongbacteria bacterium]MCG2760801.1 hypothetical protein [Candidatus Delongbacteria bacterium]